MKDPFSPFLTVMFNVFNVVMLNLQDTDDVVTTLSAAGYPLVLLETVGLGQSEIEVAQSVDILILLLPPGGGDGKCYFNNLV